jgi:antitoxin CcdA
MLNNAPGARKATNITLSADVLAEAKAYGINLSQTCDAHLREVVRREREARWLKENSAFIAAYNDTVEREGLPLEAYRTF